MLRPAAHAPQALNDALWSVLRARFSRRRFARASNSVVAAMRAGKPCVESEGRERGLYTGSHCATGSAHSKTKQHTGSVLSACVNLP
ncbi:hypothetical protein PoB_002385600 [Plakobranchus ocellatus]|uniref:Uncharacterized protein n=1 Tax=Plakobranchus ocellatus TaxID=259542 RepID=A0AAV3ZMZ7_9GAST|nr:hypothetical protein PoB_002385600 [Plakobranchus ocellatus]